MGRKLLGCIGLPCRDELIPRRTNRTAHPPIRCEVYRRAPVRVNWIAIDALHAAGRWPETPGLKFVLRGSIAPGAKALCAG